MSSIDDKIDRIYEPGLPSQVSQNPDKQTMYDLQIDERIQLHLFRDRYAPRFWRLTVCYLGFVSAYLALSTVSCESLRLFSPSDSVLIALLTTTMANIIAVLIVFAKYVFSDHET